MAVKADKTQYECSACAHKEPKWLGRCPSCGEWNTLHESKVQAAANKAAKAGKFSMPLSAVDPAEGVRVPSGMPEVDRVLGGGIMRGSSVLVGGEPGIGKSTLLLQIAAKAGVKGRILYVSGEESAAHIRLRADRLGLKRDGLEVLCSGDLPEILTTLDRVKPDLFVVDSMQTLLSSEGGAIPGTANQVKYCSLELSDWARDHASSCFLVAHVTKDGAIAGPKAAEHIVDVVLMFEQTDSDVRFLRSTKNRFGSTDEVGLFTMTETGLSEVSDPSSVFLVRREGQSPAGAAVAASWEGTRCFLVEIQALTVPGKASMTRVYSERVDAARVARVAAVLEKHAGLRFSDQDIYVNVAGGIRLIEPGIDLALALALYSARTGLALPPKLALAGELSLAGEVRPIRRMRGRAKAAHAMGFTSVIGPDELSSAEQQPGAALSAAEKWQKALTVGNAIRMLFGEKKSEKRHSEEN